MKTKRKFLALVLVVLMTMALAIPAFADTTGSITIQNATEGKDYAAYKVFDLDTSNGDMIYTYTKTGDEDTLFTALNGESSPFTLTETTTTGVYSVSLKSDKDDAAVATFLKNNEGNLGTAAAETGEGGAASAPYTFSNLALGYYYITSSLGTTATIDSVTTDVIVYDKNEGPVWDNDPDPTDDDDDNPGKVIIEGDEKVTANTANFGDTVKFDIGITATNFADGKKVSYYYIKDTLDDGFVQLTNSFAPVVTVGGTTLTKDTNYTLTVTTAANTFEIIIPWVVTAAGETQGNSLYNNLSEIHVTYEATVDTDAVVGAQGNKNKAWFTYATFDPEDTPPTEPPTTPPVYPEDPKETTTYVYAIGLLKTNGSGTPLSDAEFSVKKGEDAVNVTWDDTNKYYKVDTSSSSNKVISDENGEICIVGLDAGTYVLNETAAPGDYNLNAEDIEFVITLGGADADTETFVKTVAAMETFVNNRGTELPATGGIGTTLFITFGMIAMLCTGVFLVTNKRISKETF